MRRARCRAGDADGVGDGRPPPAPSLARTQAPTRCTTPRRSAVHPQLARTHIHTPLDTPWYMFAHTQVTRGGTTRIGAHRRCLRHARLQSHSICARAHPRGHGRTSLVRASAMRGCRPWHSHCDTAAHQHNQAHVRATIPHPQAESISSPTQQQTDTISLTTSHTVPVTSAPARGSAPSAHGGGKETSSGRQQPPSQAYAHLGASVAVALRDRRSSGSGLVVVVV